MRSALASAFAGRLRGLVAYGSQVRGDSTADSDLDLLVLLDGPINLGADLERVVAALYPLQLKSPYPIHALPVDFGEYSAGRYALYRNARQEGIVL